MLLLDFLTACLPPDFDKSSWGPWMDWKCLEKFTEIKGRKLNFSSTLGEVKELEALTSFYSHIIIIIVLLIADITLK